MRKTKLFTASVLLATIVLTSAVPCSAASSTGSTASLFTESKVAALTKKADQMPIVNDKGTSKMTKGLEEFGTYPTRKGTILISPDTYAGVPIGRAAIVYSKNKIVESTPFYGVVTRNNDWNYYHENIYGVKVKDTTPEQDEQAADWCYNQVGKPYNGNYLNPYTRDEFYGSQLIYAAYLDNFQINLDTYSWLQAIHPMEIVDSKKTELIYRYYNETNANAPSWGSGDDIPSTH